MTYVVDAKPEAPFVPAIARRKLPVNGWVYFVLGEDSGRFKIGRTNDVEKRIKAMQVGCPEGLSVYAVLCSKHTKDRTGVSASGCLCHRIRGGPMRPEEPG